VSAMFEQMPTNNNGITFMIVINSIQSAMLRYGTKLTDFATNWYQYFATRCGYKALNYFYWIFEKRENKKLGYQDIKTILSITQDETIYNTVMEDLKSVLK
jgi:hypothetical protein